MNEKDDIIFELGKLLVKILITLQFKKEEVVEVLEILENDENITKLTKWIKQERTTISKFIERNLLDELKGLLFEVASEIANGDNKNNIA